MTVIRRPQKEPPFYERISIKCTTLISLSVLFIYLFVSRTASTNRTGSVSGLGSSHHNSVDIDPLGNMNASPGQNLWESKMHMLYGTAWKKDDTARLVEEAVTAGFRFIDTACQPKHYNEAGVGEGWTRAASKLGLNRSDLYLQTKFTSIDGQDPNRIPYNQNAPLNEQVSQSVEQSLINLRTEYIDVLVLHSPMRTFEETLVVWQTLEGFVDKGKIKALGISNCYDLRKMEQLFSAAHHKPKVLQNRFYADSRFDVGLREFCNQNDVRYQSFWTLSANRQALSSPRVISLAKSKNLTPQTLMYAFMMSLGHTPLSGTTNAKHMNEDISTMQRITQGESIFDSSELEEFAYILGIPKP